MDVILDSNAYLSDIRMESIRFKNLFDYLRMTKSSLVVPRLVREETIAKHKFLLETQSKKVSQAVQELNRLIVDKRFVVNFAAPDSEVEERALRKKFRAGVKGVSVRSYAEVSGVDVNEVFLRGVKRRRPANKNGEELRDVIIWLITLHLAEAEKKPYALITADGGFWNESEIHEHIQDDIKKRGVEVSVFRTIEDFIKSSAPAPQPVDAGIVSKFFDLSIMANAVAEAAAVEFSNTSAVAWRSSSVRSARLTSSHLSSATLYEVNKQTKFAELSYEISVLVDLAVNEQSNIFTPSGGMRPQQSSVFDFMSSPASVPLSSLLSEQPFNVHRGVFDFAFPSAPPPNIAIERSYVISGVANVSIRLVSDTLSETELDGIEIRKVDRASGVREAAGAGE